MIEPEPQHVYPLNDLVAHEMSADCLCGPKLVADDIGEYWPRLIVVHHSLDGRENHE